MVRIYFDAEALEAAIQEEDESAVLDIVSFNVYEASSKNGEYTFVGNYPYDPRRNFIDVPDESSISNWFCLTYLDSAIPAIESEMSEPTLGENIDEVLVAVIESLGDLNRESPAFTDEEYVLKIREAIRRFKGAEQPQQLSSSDISIVVLLVRISCCYDLAYDSAKYYELTLTDGVTLNKGERVKHYLSIAESLEKRYKQLLDDMGGDDGQVLGTPSMEIVSMTRDTHFVGDRLPVISNRRFSVRE